MTTPAQRIEDRAWRGYEADLEARLDALFRRWPTLCGFSVRSATDLLCEGLDVRHAADLFVTEISVFPQTGLEAPAEICHAVAAAIVGLVDECPEVCDLVRERTFARVFH